MIRISPANKIPNSFIESRNSIIGSDISSARKGVNIFSGSDSKFPDVNQSFQYVNHSDDSSIKKTTSAQNISQQYINIQNDGQFNSKSNILREKSIDQNNISNIRSNDSITISHHTLNHSHIESEKLNISVTQNPMVVSRSAKDLDRVIRQSNSTSTIRRSKISDENTQPNNASVECLPLQYHNIPNQVNKEAQIVNNTNLGSPISIFNPNKKLYTPKMQSVEKKENMSLEELISRIDSRREVFKKSIKDEREEYFIANANRTPEFTENNTSVIYNNSTTDPVSGNYELGSNPRPEANTAGKKIMLC